MGEAKHKDLLTIAAIIVLALAAILAGCGKHYTPHRAKITAVFGKDFWDAEHSWLTLDDGRTIYRRGIVGQPGDSLTVEVADDE